MNKKISIAIDAMGGDNSPKKTIEGVKFFLDRNNSFLQVLLISGRATSYLLYIYGIILIVYSIIKRKGMIMEKTTNYGGTFLQGYIKATYEQLLNTFGPPHMDQCDNYKNLSGNELLHEIITNGIHEVGGA